MNERSNLDRADSLIAQGAVGDAIAILHECAKAGDAEAARRLAAGYLSGRQFGRDLGKARTYFALAAELGHTQSRDAMMGLTAAGAGGQRDWPAALALLEADPEQAIAQRELELIRAMDIDATGRPATAAAGRAVDQLEGAEIFPRFLTERECDYLRQLAEPRLRASVVVHPQTGAMMADPIRTSDAAAFPLVAERPFIHALNQRIAAATATDYVQGEPLQVLRYAPGQQYKRHFDALPPGQDQRIITFLIYLNEGYGGGETIFPDAGFRFKGATGDALMFRNTLPNGDPDLRTAHIGGAVLTGTKYLASKWIRANPLDWARSR